MSAEQELDSALRLVGNFEGIPVQWTSSIDEVSHEIHHVCTFYCFQ